MKQKGDYIGRQNQEKKARMAQTRNEDGGQEITGCFAVRAGGGARSRGWIM